MKKILFLMLSFVSLHAGIEIHTSILCKEPSNPGYYRWVDKPLVDFIKNIKEREVITYCDDRGFFGRLFNDPYLWNWCVQPIKSVYWQYIKDYYVFTLQAPGYEEEDIIVTGDQLFKCVECKLTPSDNSDENKNFAKKYSNVGMAWVSAEVLYKRYSEDNIGCTTICCSPRFINGEQPVNKTARIISIFHFEDKHNQPKEFFSFTIDDAQTFLAGKAHYWLLGN